VEPPAETAQPPAASRADFDPADFTEAEIASGAFALAFAGSKRASPVRWDTMQTYGRLLFLDVEQQLRSKDKPAV